ncbi:hypothetical protein PVAP13_1KG127600 [Panicum virgatum]|uniref:Uncharacterized protein n=1 Tax=Panicum virgatum TaxID=38727 RepID=A0A8T0X5Q9_PANVG|nr:hypothetical protein PVAP13_1KG127600 [Panicum virgatum]
MDAKAPPAILVAVLLACLAFSPKCCDGGGGSGGEERAAGGLRRPAPPAGEGTIGSDRFRIVLCFRHSLSMYCGPELSSCYCCMALPGCPCYAEQQECWDFCPTRMSPTRAAAPSPSALRLLPARRGGDDGTVVGRCSRRTWPGVTRRQELIL